MKLCLTMLDLYCWCKLYMLVWSFWIVFAVTCVRRYFVKQRLDRILFFIFIIFISVDKILVTCANGERILLYPFHIQFVSFQSFPSTVLGSGSVSDIDTVWDIGNTVCPCLDIICLLRSSCSGSQDFLHLQLLFHALWVASFMTLVLLCM